MVLSATIMGMAATKITSVTPTNPAYGDSITVAASGATGARVSIQVNQAGGGYLVASGEVGQPIVLTGEYWQTDPPLAGDGSVKLMMPSPSRGWKTVDEKPLHVNP